MEVDLDLKSHLDLRKIREGLFERERRVLSPLAALGESAVRRNPWVRDESDYRPPFSVDADRILHSLAYARYIDKTQVFYLVKNDHITHRVLHVQLVSKIARTIGRFLNLNEDLIEAVSLGHDIGHPPFGHDGESFLSGICRRRGVGYFHHNIQSVQFLDRVENRGAGWNLCLQTLDGIVCHDGEIHNRRLEPERGKTFQKLDEDIRLKKKDREKKLVPMTLEGCAARMADTISYVGRDAEDAIRLGVIRRSDLPAESVRVLGDTNGTIVFHLVTDIIRNSVGKGHIAFGAECSEALERLKKFNMERIYFHKEAKKHFTAIRDLYEILFDRILEDIEKRDRSAPVYSEFLDGLSANYIDAHRPEEIVRDFIAGMTDRYFLKQFPENMRPGPVFQ
ncbi:Phosphohydrolase [Candidatus Desulfarcum epimagneticum]|uniref:Phosphohydrolase n=1 Tax=uncultured Desulfobacteraceae bacterium TaxID=218296 RepID=A0A484HE12_9BACT|nr:Phosphohydrolase [uncultured Desulfobacteraceae bacterium]